MGLPEVELPGSHAPIAARAQSLADQTAGVAQGIGQAQNRAPTSLSNLTGFAGGRPIQSTAAGVRVRAPNGLIYLLPQDKVATAQAKGGVLV